MIKGYIITYNTKSITRINSINSFLFGRVVKIKRNNKNILYYYSGFLDDKNYYKLSNGCYFIPMVFGDQNYSEIMRFAPDISLLLSDVDLVNSELYNARQFFRNKYNSKEVNNLDN